MFRGFKELRKFSFYVTQVFLMPHSGHHVGNKGDWKINNSPVGAEPEKRNLFSIPVGRRLYLRPTCSQNSVLTPVWSSACFVTWNVSRRSCRFSQIYFLHWYVSAPLNDLEDLSRLQIIFLEWVRPKYFLPIMPPSLPVWGVSRTGRGEGRGCRKMQMNPNV